MKDKITISLHVINNIMNYLNNRPHGEVRSLIDEIIKNVNDNNLTIANDQDNKG